jgi:hypothetical protein
MVSAHEIPTGQWVPGDNLIAGVHAPLAHCWYEDPSTQLYSPLSPAEQAPVISPPLDPVPLAGGAGAGGATGTMDGLASELNTTVFRVVGSMLGSLPTGCGAAGGGLAGGL